VHDVSSARLSELVNRTMPTSTRETCNCFAYQAALGLFVVDLDRK
jgi:hypothetical protein